MRPRSDIIRWHSKDFVKLLIPEHLVGAVVGNGGETMSKVRESCPKARLENKFSTVAEDRPVRTLHIIGSPKQIVVAEQLVADAIQAHIQGRS